MWFIVGGILGFILGWMLRERRARQDMAAADWSAAEIAQPATVSANEDRLRAEIGDLEEQVRARDARIHELELTSDAAAAADATPVAWSPPATATTEPDDLKKIKGIGPVLEKRLNSLGITTYRQIGQFTDDDIARVAEVLKSFPDRIRQDDWISQAKAAHEAKYGDRL